MTSVHVIIVNYNSGDWLSRAVASVWACRSEADLHISVIDNASADNSMEIAKAAHSQVSRVGCADDADHEALIDARIDWLINTDNVGFAAANNQVLNHLEADYALLMNPDCELKPGSLTALFEAFNKYSNCAMASCRILNEDGSLQATCRRRFPTPWSALMRMLQLHKIFAKHALFAGFDYGERVSANEPTHAVEAVSGAFMMVKRQAIQDVGVLDEAYFMHCEDLDWCKRFELAGWQVYFVPNAEVMHAKGVSSQSRPVRVLWTLHKGMNRFFDKFYRQTYSWPVRITVKAGIGASFITRAGLALLRASLNALRLRVKTMRSHTDKPRS